MKKFLIVIVVLTIAMFGVDAMAGYMMKVDGDTFMTTGVKARWRWTMVNPDPNHGRVDQSIPEARIYAKGQITDLVKFFFNFDYISSSTANFIDLATGYTRNGARLTDAAMVLDLAKEAKIQAGVYRKAVSRVALQDSYQYILVNGPRVASATYISDPDTTGSYRGEGITLWGDLADSKVRYYVAAWFDGHPAASANGLGLALGTNPNDELGLSGRLVFNFMDPEKGYACPGCYLGRAQVANIGIGYYTQDFVDGAGADKTYSVMALDAFYDANGVTGEFGYLQYDYDNAAGQKPTGIYLEGAYAVDKWQPAARYETWDNDAAAGDYDQITLGINYFLAKQAAKIGLEYQMFDPDGGTDVDTWTLQAQVQF